MTRTWLFGEAEYESTETFKENFDRLWNCGEQCGYMVETVKFRHSGGQGIHLLGGDEENVLIYFEYDKVTKIRKKHFKEEELVINH